ncbi:MAG: AEC family transporter [Clostridia bacterium]|nr:AEC family transporter [Clostridia bacterium]MDD4543279.1 AEC family transporter [Clostridia bacterium]HXK72097.1 AEC family transporter [Clostridia bacterium]
MVIVLFIIMLIGVLLGKMKVINSESRSTISFLIINVSMPMLIVSSSNLEFNEQTKNESMWLIIMSVAAFFFSILLAQLIFKKAVPRCATVFSNAGYMGLPVLNSILGPKGLFLGAIFQMVFHLFTWTYGISLFTKSNKFKDSLKKMINPSLIAVAIAIVLMFTGWKIPDTIQTVLKMMGELTTPLSMLLIGATLAQVSLKEVIKLKQIYIVTALRLLIIPAFVLLFLLFPSIPKISVYVVFVINAMPSAAITGILAMKYNNDEKLASSIVAFSTLISIITLFLITNVFDVASVLGLV